MKEFFVNNLVLFYKGEGVVKLMAGIKLSALPTLAISSFEYFTGLYYTNLSFLYTVLFVVLLDHLLGSYWHYFEERNFTFERNLTGLMKKLLISIAGYSILIVMYDALDEIEFLNVYFMAMIKMMVLLYPGGSALVSMSKITKGQFPPAGLLKKIKNFEETGDIESLKSKTEKDENTI